MFSPFYMSGGDAGIMIFASILLPIVTLVVSIILFNKFGKTESDLIKKEGWNWKSFFCFDRLMLSGILKFLYILSAVGIIAAWLWFWLANISATGIVGFFIGLFVGALVAALNELLCRVTFEYLMLLIKVTENTSDIKKAVCGGVTGGFTGGLIPSAPATAPVEPAPVAAPTAPTTAPAAPAAAPVATPASTQDTAPVIMPTENAAPTQAAAPAAPTQANSAWFCTKCGLKNEEGKFCRSCGTPRL